VIHSYSVLDTARPVTADRTRATNPSSFATDPEQRRSVELRLQDVIFLPIDRYPNSLKENDVSKAGLRDPASLFSSRLR
jgi:hypothetical protein